MLQPDHFSAAFIQAPIIPADGLMTPTAIGGAPWLPDTLEWPRNELGEPLHFLAQLDLGSLPYPEGSAEDIVALPDFQRQGMLFFFLEGDGTADSTIYMAEQEPFCKVLYSPVVTTPDLVKLPSDLLPLDPNFQKHWLIWDNYLTRPEFFAEARPNLTLPRTPLKAAPCLTHRHIRGLTLLGAGQRLDAIKRLWLKIFLPFDHPGRALFTLRGIKRAPGLIHWLWLRIFGGYDSEDIIDYEDLVDDDKTSWSPRDCQAYFPALRWAWLDGLQKDEDFSYYNRVVDVPATYPWHWMQVERTALVVLHEYWGIAAPGGEASTASGTLEPHMEGARDWIRTAQEHSEYESVSPKDRQHFQAWLQALIDLKHGDKEVLLDRHRQLNRNSERDERSILFMHELDVLNLVKHALKDGFHMAWPYCVASGQLAEVPAEFIEAMKSIYAMGGDGPSEPHQSFGELGHAYQSDPSENGWVPLLQIATSDATNTCWSFSMGQIAFWIAPEALLRRDFSEVIARYHYN